jgi:hypothetical protein
MGAELGPGGAPVIPKDVFLERLCKYLADPPRHTASERGSTGLDAL